ncbi:Uncharacterised protein [Segatella copri]|nr:Uncharacterised protein [Segatella copri]
MIGTLPPVVYQSGILAILFKFIYHNLRLLDRYCPICCAMDNPEWQIAQSTHIAQTHTQDINSIRIAWVILLHPV